jgi:hypothetical protein
VTTLREYLSDELERRIRQRGVVVWQDSEREYAEVAASLCPPGAKFFAYQGSWYALRREVEPLIGGDAPPNLVVYASARPPSEDPIEELRSAGGAYIRRLSTLVKEAMKGQLSEQRLADIGSRARTLLEAEAAIDGDAGGDVYLIGILGASDARTMAVRILTGERSAELEAAGAWPAAIVLWLGRRSSSLRSSPDGPDRGRDSDRRPGNTARLGLGTGQRGTAAAHEGPDSYVAGRPSPPQRLRRIGAPGR